MPTYVFRLHDGPDIRPELERVHAADDYEARTLADLRLMLDRQFTRIEAHLDGCEIFCIQRDSQRER